MRNTQLDEAEDHAQPQTRPLAYLLGGEEWLEHTREHVGRHSSANI